MVVGPFVVEKVVIFMKMWKTVHWKAGRLAKVKKMRHPKWQGFDHDVRIWYRSNKMQERVQVVVTVLFYGCIRDEKIQIIY